MLGFAWLAIRQAEAALKSGRLEEAQRLLDQPAARRHKHRRKCLGRIAAAYVARAHGLLARDEAEAAWQDLVKAELLEPSGPEVRQLRQALVRSGLARVRALLEAGQPGEALEAASTLRNRSAASSDLAALEALARNWQEAREQAARGEFGDALRALPPALTAPIAVLENFRHELRRQQQGMAALLVQLHQAVEQQRWRDVVDLAEQVLIVAPQHAQARKARSQAWKAIQPATVILGQSRASLPEAATPAELGSRFLLWMDGIGGYLVCLSAKVSIGQATEECYVDVPLFADVSRVHATLTRDAEGYLLEALRSARVNGEPVEKALLRPNDRVTLGTSFQFQFQQPVPVSASARIDVVSGHRLQLAVDAVLLMADTLVFGPGPQAHVCIPELKRPVVLFRQKDGLGVRHAGNLCVDGQGHCDRALLGPTSTVSVEECAFAIEPVGQRLGYT